jgi:hypothetical protein
MKKHEVKLGGQYLAKVSGKVVVVHIDGENPHGGWDATNVQTKKKVRVKSAQRLRHEVQKSKPLAQAIPSQAGAPAADGKGPDAKAEKAAKVAAWRKEVAEKAAKPDPQLDAAIRAADADRAAKKAKAAKPKGQRKGGALDAAVQVLKTAGGGPLGCKAMVQTMLAKGYWKTDGKTPSATLYTAVTMLGKAA